MAEQIRSFWSHLCGIFGAIFGMIAGGTLVTIEHADGVATGKFVWTNSCFYEDDTNPGLTPYCDALLAEGNDERCILYLTAVATSAGFVETTKEIVSNIYGGNSNAAITAVQYVVNNKKENMIRNGMSCSAANCYTNAPKTLGWSSARIEYE